MKSEKHRNFIIASTKCFRGHVLKGKNERRNKTSSHVLLVLVHSFIVLYRYDVSVLTSLAFAVSDTYFLGRTGQFLKSALTIWSIASLQH